MFISNSRDWSVRHTMPGPGRYGSTTWTVTRPADAHFRSRAHRRSRTDRPRGPAPTTATAEVLLLFTGDLRSTKSDGTRTAPGRTGQHAHRTVARSGQRAETLGGHGTAREQVNGSGSAAPADDDDRPRGHRGRGGRSRLRRVRGAHGARQRAAYRTAGREKTRGRRRHWTVPVGRSAAAVQCRGLGIRSRPTSARTEQSSTPRADARCVAASAAAAITRRLRPDSRSAIGFPQ